MKYHLTFDGKQSVCKSVIVRPDTFVFDEKGFESHFYKEGRCKKCEKLLNLEETTITKSKLIP